MMLDALSLPLPDLVLIVMTIQSAERSACVGMMHTWNDAWSDIHLLKALGI